MIKNIMEHGVTNVKIIGADYACSSYKKLRNKIFQIDEALNEMPIPNKNCSHEPNGNVKDFVDVHLYHISPN